MGGMGKCIRFKSVHCVVNFPYTYFFNVSISDNYEYFRQLQPLALEGEADSDQLAGGVEGDGEGNEQHQR